MKGKLIYLIALVIIGTAWSCSEDKPSGDTIFVEDETVTTEFDTWLQENYIRQYNIQYVYRFVDSESDNNYYLVPADYDKAKTFAKIIKHAMLEPYDEVTGGTIFLKKYFPKMIFIVGNEAYNNNSTTLLGVAEGGMRITLYGINFTGLDNMADLNQKFQTCHHEFAHILHQTIMYSEEFRDISGSDYIGDSWSNLAPLDALDRGFISSYSSKEHSEDFVEIYSHYITLTADEWESSLGQASEEGRAKLERKLEMVKDYFETTWGIDLDEMKTVVLRRTEEIHYLDYDNF